MKRNKERLFFSCFLGIFVIACLWGNNDQEKWSNKKSAPKLTSIGEVGTTTTFLSTVAFASYTRHHDLNIGAAVLGPNAPTATTVGTARGLGFDADNEAAHITVEVPFEWDGASNMTLQVHWYPTSGDAVAENETVKWDATYRSIADGEAVDNGTVVIGTVTFTGGASETDKESYEASITIVYSGGNQPLTVDDKLFIQFDRDVTTDTYSGAGIVTLWELEYTANALATH